MTRVSVVYSPAPRQLREWRVELPAPASAAQALESCGLLAEFPALDPAFLTFGIWGRKVPPAQPLRDGDRLEVYRVLRVDPKVARRERFSRQGAKSAGLFASKRAGAKAGY